MILLECQSEMGPWDALAILGCLALAGFIVYMMFRGLKHLED